MCPTSLRGDEKPEHILLKALGGRETTKNALCDRCNGDFGSGPDKEFSVLLEPLRNLGNFKKGDGRSPPTIRKVKADGVQFDLEPGGIPILVPATSMKAELDGSVSITARDAKHAQKLLRSVAQKFGIPSERHEEYVEQTMQNAHQQRQVVPAVQFTLELGCVMAQRSMIKACLVLWNEVVGNAELSSDRYDAARLFSNGNQPVAPLVEKDARQLPLSEKEYGTNPNLIWVGSDDRGRVLGYYKVYGAIGWCFELCRTGAPPNLRRCLVSNPCNTAVRACGSDVLLDVSFEWVGAASAKDFDEARRSLFSILLDAQSNALSREMDVIFSEVCREMGIDEDEVPPSAESAAALEAECKKRFMSVVEGYERAQTSGL